MANVFKLPARALNSIAISYILIIISFKATQNNTTLFANPHDLAYECAEAYQV
jgi:hypothetical protein